MAKIRQSIMWLTLNLLILLAALSIYGAFLGAEKARTFFNSPPLAVFWGIMTLLLTVGLFLYPSLRRRPLLFILHAGCVFVLIGGLIGSQAGQKWTNRKLGRDKIYKSVMLIPETQVTNRVYIEKDAAWANLPFELRLDDFDLDYYPGVLTIETTPGTTQHIRAIPGDEITLEVPPITLRILDTFENCRLHSDEAGQMIPYEETGPGINPACSIEITRPDLPPQRRTIFARFPGHTHPGDPYTFSYNAAISDFRSQLTVLENNQPKLTETIEVNHPLHYGGYHFYQHSYDNKQASYTILTVVSDAGLNLVYLGYLLLGVGVFVYFWFGPLFRRFRSSASISSAGS